MISAARRRISPLETVMLTAAATFASGIFVMPRLFVADAGRAGGLALLLACGLGVLWVIVISRAAGPVPHHAIASRLRHRLPYLGYPWLAAVALMETLVAYGALGAYESMVTAVAMPTYPGVSLAALLAFGAWTGARQRMEQLSRAVFIFFGAFMVFATLNFLALLARIGELPTLLPGPHIALGPIVTADVDGLFLFGGFGSLALILPYAVKSRRGLPHVATGAIVTVVLLLLAYAMTIGTLGPDYVLSQAWPVVSALHTLVLHSFLLDRPGLVVVFAWSAIVLSFVAIHLWAAGEAVCVLTGSERGRSWWTFGFATSTVVLSALSEGDPVKEEIFARSVLSPAALVLLVGWLVAALLLNLLSRRKVAGA